MKKGVVSIPIIILVIVILGIAIGLLGTKTWNPSWNPFKQSVKPIEEAIAKLSQTDSFKVNGDITAEFQGERDVNVSVSFEELVDSAKVFIDFDLILGIEGLMAQLKGEVIASEKEIYLKVKTLPDVGFIGIDIESIKNQWFMINLGQMVETSEVDEEKLIEDVNEIIKGKEVFEIKKDYGQEEQGRHYLVSIKKNALKQLIPEFLKLGRNYVSEEERENYDQQLETFLNDFDNNFDSVWSKVSPLEFEVWIDDYLNRLKFEKQVEYSDEENQGIIKIFADLEFSEFNKGFSIQPPEEYKTIEEIISPDLFIPTL